MQEMGQEDYLFIIQNAFSDIEHSVLSSLVAFNAMVWHCNVLIDNCSEHCCMHMI